MSGEYYKTKESVEEYIHLAKDVNGLELIEKLKLILPARSSILEIGSGPGSDWEILNQTYEATGSDNSPEFLKHLNLKYPDEEFLDLDAISLITNKRFDGIFSNKVLHHLKDAELKMSIKRQSEIINQGGIICHSLWKGEGFEVFKGLFVNYHTEEDLQKMFQEHFEILSILRYQEFEKEDSLLLIGKKK